MQYVDLLLPFQHPVNYALNVRLVAAQQVPELINLGRQGATARMLLKAQDRLLQSPILDERGIRSSGIDFVIELRKIALGPTGQVNEVGHGYVKHGPSLKAPFRCHQNSALVWRRIRSGSPLGPPAQNGGGIERAVRSREAASKPLMTG
jgi:hypothetical protein